MEMIGHDDDGEQLYICRELFLGNLPNGIEPDIIKVRLGCKRVRVVTDTRRMVDDRANTDVEEKTYAFATFDDAAAAKEAHGTRLTFGGREARVYFAFDPARKRSASECSPISQEDNAPHQRKVRPRRGRIVGRRG